mgnify:CR=1 FL=1
MNMLSSNIFIMELSCPDIARNALPGQFVNVDCAQFLNRPISICSADREKGTFSLGIRIKGTGTRRLSGMTAGEQVMIHGPLGHGFDLTGTVSCIAVGGGIGIFPLMFLLDETKRLGIPSRAVCGYKSAIESFCTLELRKKADKICFTSDCGDMDFHGNAADALNDIKIKGDETVFTCGPVQIDRKSVV